MAYVLSEGEQHGFRKAENTRVALDEGATFTARMELWVPCRGHLEAHVTIMQPATPDSLRVARVGRPGSPERDRRR